MRVAFACLLLVGCDKLFDLDEIAQAPREAGSVGDVGIPPDVPPSCVGHDEDGDKIPDACDTCPIDPNVGDGDNDGDMIGDVCDPHPTMPGDTVVFFTPFTDTTGWSVVINAAGLGDSVVLQNGSLSRSFSSFERISVPLQLAAGATTNDSFFIYLEGAGSDFTCRILAGACPSLNVGINCLVAQSSIWTEVEFPVVVSLAEISRLEVARDPNGTDLDCRAHTSAGIVGASQTVMIDAGTLSLQANNVMRATLSAAILYGQ